jgi:L-ascorbate metabolism protein UlaG (beta-lactamase superfamily)
MVEVVVEPMERSVAEDFAKDSTDASTMVLWWLGQAGFALRAGRCRLLIDPYLSDSLAGKYAGTEFPHQRMMPPPILADQLPPLDAVLCSHAHSDHMDPGTLPVVAARHPACRFIVPAAEAAVALQRSVPADRMTPVNAGDTVEVVGVEVQVVPAAHEHIKVNAKGEHHHLGFILRYAGVVVYHSGDTLPFDGLADLLRSRGVDVALLPVNGRDEHRTSRGVVGNMTLEEAIELCLNAGIGAMIPHHFGMFEFNTIDPRLLRTRAAELDARLLCVLPDARHRFIVRGATRPSPTSGIGARYESRN